MPRRAATGRSRQRPCWLCDGEAGRGYLFGGVVAQATCHHIFTTNIRSRNVSLQEQFKNHKGTTTATECCKALGGCCNLLFIFQYRLF